MLKRLLAVALCAALPLLTGLSAQAAEPTNPFPVPEQTWDYFDANPPGADSITAYSLGGHAIRQDAQDKLTATLDAGIAGGFSAVELERGILSLVKLGNDPSDYQKQNLLSILYTHENIYQDGLEGACLALMAYEASESPAAASARNAPPSVIDYIISSQQRSGGFARTTGRSAEVQVTAQAIIALAAHRDQNYVHTGVERAIDWLSTQQNANATFSDQKRPHCETTAIVLTALRVWGVPLDDPRFVKNNADLLDALALFENTDGGYAAFSGEDSAVAATEAAVIARITDQTGLAPHLAPTAYPGYETPVPPEPDPVITYLVFFFKFMGMLLILYLLVHATPRIAKMIDRRRGKHLDVPSDDTSTFEIHIPMKAQVPDLDEVLKSQTAANSHPLPDPEQKPQKPAD